MSKDIYFIGHCTRDEITIKGVTEHHPGGGVYFGGASAGWCLKNFADGQKSLHILTIGNPDDYTQIRREMEECGAHLDLIEYPCTTTFLHSFKDEDPDQRISSVGNVARSFEWADIEKVHAKLFYVNPLFFGEVDPSLFEKMKQNCQLLFVDAQGLIRRRDGPRIYHKAPEDLSTMLKFVDILKVDAEEAASLTGITSDTDAACKHLLGLGLKYLICTQKEGVFVYHGDTRTQSEFGAWTLEGRTGRGDTVSAAFLLCHFILGFDIQKSLDIAAKGCTNKMQHAGCARKSDFDSL